MNVSEVMTMNVNTCSKSSLLKSCAHVMKEQNIGAVPVLDDNGRLVGIITDRDITIRAVAEGSDCSQDTVGNFMTPSPVTVSPETSIDEASELMGKHQIRRLPVLQNDELVGIVTFGDLSVSAEETMIAHHTLRDVSVPIHH